MAVDKSDIVEMLKELAELTAIDDGDVQSFRVRAYESAQHAVEGLSGDVPQLSAAALQAVPGIGKSTAAKIRELCDSGRVEKLETLRQKHPTSVREVYRLPGVGPKGLARLRRELGVASLDDLRRALDGHALRDLSGFGARSEEKLRQALERALRDGAGRRTPIAIALPLAERIVAELSRVPGVARAAYCGSLRRFSETVGDLDIVVGAHHPAAVMESVLAMPLIDAVLARGETKLSFVSKKGLQVDVRVVAPIELGAALLYFTGSKGHNIRLRQRALERGLTLNEYALAEQTTGKVVARESEDDIYRALGLPWVHPVLREDAGELELAERGALPPAIAPRDIHGDFHLHTSLSGDARSSLDEMLAAARARHYRVLAVTDHAIGLPLSGVSAEALREQASHIAALGLAAGRGLAVLSGVELNIAADGGLDYDPDLRGALGFCLASVHDHFDLDEAAQTRRIVAAMRDPAVKMIGHLSARTIGKRPPIALDIDAVLAAAEETGTAIEVNGSLPRLDASVDVLRRARGRDIALVLTSDAHHASELGRVEHAALQVLRAGVSPEQVVNTWSGAKLLHWARHKGRLSLGLG